MICRTCTHKSHVVVILNAFRDCAHQSHIVVIALECLQKMHTPKPCFSATASTHFKAAHCLLATSCNFHDLCSVLAMTPKRSHAIQHDLNHMLTRITGRKLGAKTISRLHAGILCLWPVCHAYTQHTAKQRCSRCMASFTLNMTRQAQQAQLGAHWSNQLSPTSSVLCRNVCTEHGIT